jgi:hypothetical protein
VDHYLALPSHSLDGRSSLLAILNAQATERS